MRVSYSARCCSCTLTRAGIIQLRLVGCSIIRTTRVLISIASLSTRRKSKILVIFSSRKECKIFLHDVSILSTLSVRFYVPCNHTPSGAACNFRQYACRARVDRYCCAARYTKSNSRTETSCEVPSRSFRAAAATKRHYFISSPDDHEYYRGTRAVKKADLLTLAS